MGRDLAILLLVDVSGSTDEGPSGVTVRAIKRFDERYDTRIAQRIAALEPEHYTRAGAALRHATALLMREPAAHRLLLLRCPTASRTTSTDTTDATASRTCSRRSSKRRRRVCFRSA